VSPFAGSVPEKSVPGQLPLSLQGAIDRGLKQNLGVLLSDADIRAARGQRWQQLSALLPHVDAAPYLTASQINLGELGLGSFGGLQIPASVGPFSYFDSRFAVTQTLFDWKAISAARAARQILSKEESKAKTCKESERKARPFVEDSVRRRGRRQLVGWRRR
jgi:outer membrane protein TolC